MPSAFTTMQQSAAMARIWDFPKLKGQENYQPWAKHMKSALKCNRLWDIVEKGVELLPEEPPKEKSHVEQAEGEQPRKVIDQRGPTVEEANQYKEAVNEIQDQNSQAAELIYAMCEDKPAEHIEDEEWATNRWITLQTHYMDSGFTLRFTKYKEFIHITMANSDNNIETYCTNIRSRARELKRMGAGIDKWLMVAVLLDNLGEKYQSFVHRIVATGDEIPDFNRIVTMLYEEDRLLKSDKASIAMAATMKRYKKEMDEKSSGRGNGNGNTNSGRGGNNSGGGRGGRGNNKNNNNGNGGGDRHSKNPNNVNYKGEGDPPECSKCPPNAKGNLKKHWPFDCWTLHEDRMPEKYRNNKPKANKATAQKDDFEDANSTRFSGMAMSATFQQGPEGDDELWGWSINEATPKMGGEVVTEEPKIQALDQSLTENDHFMNGEISCALPFTFSPTFVSTLHFKFFPNHHDKKCYR